jgi:ATP-dependent RNA helicase DeaD
MSTFAEMGLSEPMMATVTGLGYEEPTPIQTAAIPPLMEGSDILAQAQTGTGKTAAFAIPIVERLNKEELRPQALILAPTRELAVQVAGAVYDIGHNQGVRVLAVYGGQPIDRQLRGLAAGVHVVVGTPGRIMDHIRRGTLHLDHIQIVVLDEGDQMLDMGFIEDIEFILEQVPDTRQTALFSATVPPRIRSLANRYMRDPVSVTTQHEVLAMPKIKQYAYQVPGRAKSEALVRLLDALAPSSAMVFCRTRRDVDELSERLQIQGYPGEGIHGDMAQAERERVLKRFREGSTDILVATDVAARGLDIPDVSHVFNFDLPTDPEQYIHRIGRTGRAGKTGVAVSLVSPRERMLMGVIERISGKKVKVERLPTLDDVTARRWEAFRDSVRAMIDEGDMATYQVLAEELGEDYDQIDVAAAALKLLHATERSVAETPMLEQLQNAPVASFQAQTGMSRLYLSAGREAGIRPQDIVGMIANEAHMAGADIGSIEIFDRSSFVEVPAPASERVIRALDGIIFRGTELRIARAKPVHQSSHEPSRHPRSHTGGYDRPQDNRPVAKARIRRKG